MKSQNKRDIIAPPEGEAGAGIPAFLEPAREGVVLSVRLQPKSAKNEFVAVIGNSVKIRVTAPPIKGAANEACREFLAKTFGIARSRVRILAGAQSRQKRILLTGLDKETAWEAMADLL